MTGQPDPSVPSAPAAQPDPSALDPVIWPDSFRRGADGELTLDGHRASALAERFGTPLYVESEEVFRARAAAFRTAFTQAFDEHGAPVSVYYAGKAFLCAAVVRWAREEGLNLDTASGGELALGLAAGMEPARIALHGNNKSEQEIRRALEAGVGRIVADSVPELLLIERIAGELGATAPVMIRVTPGVHAETHEFIATAHEDQKFGLSLAADTARLAWEQIPAAVRAEAWPDPKAAPEHSVAELAAVLAEHLPHLDLRGLHCHIGSQVFAPEGFDLAARRVLTTMARLRDRLGRALPEADLGGGYGIGYVAGDAPRPIAQLAQAIAASVVGACAQLELPLPHLSFEPGRAITGPAGVTLYTVGTIKDVALEAAADAGQPSVRRYVAVDGGMSDNARPILYGSEYTVTRADRAPTGEQVLSRVVGKHCESGDILVRECLLPADLAAGDLLAVPATGAYCWSLSSNYNFLTRPPVVAVAPGREPRVIVHGQSIQDLLDRDAEL
ncbi:diaminopimelate decarboxylase [Rothia kristinae]|uniref:Diaminopimelate decarboxylase n=1 Tax=Rothia kristinae TaxID=37923 RepID=A0A7T4MTH9_9MICC|nr:diaminopimelate decarboxylase [Rothia kristinae]QQC59348.1 diaminopimelate decarboxylase [Rothia kristinae]